MQVLLNALLEQIYRLISIITDLEMFRIIKPTICGDICHASVRYARAINKLISSLYDPRQFTSYIIDVNAINLFYGWAMSSYIPDGKFDEWEKTSTAIWTAFKLRRRPHCDLRHSTIQSSETRQTKPTKLYFLGKLRVPDVAARSRGRLSTSSEYNDHQACDDRWKAAQSAIPVLGRRLPSHPKTDLLVCPDKALRSVRSTAPLLFWSRNEAG